MNKPKRVYTHTCARTRIYTHYQKHICEKIRSFTTIKMYS